jgi:hypothetical protein
MAAIMAGRPIVEVRMSSASDRNHRNAHRRDRAFEDGFAAPERQRRKVTEAGGEDVQIVVFASADHFLNAAVIRSDLLVRNRPVRLDSA